MVQPRAFELLKGFLGRSWSDERRGGVVGLRAERGERIQTIHVTWGAWGATMPLVRQGPGVEHAMGTDTRPRGPYEPPTEFSQGYRGAF